MALIEPEFVAEEVPAELSGLVNEARVEAPCPEVTAAESLEALVDVRAGGDVCMLEGLAPPAPAPTPLKTLVLGDENLLFTAGMQAAYPDIEFTVATVLSRQNLESLNFNPSPLLLNGRVRHAVDPCRVGKHFRQHEFDSLILYLPGLGFKLPPELKTADRPLFAYRTHLFVFHVIRHAKLVLRGEGHLHIAWPEETGLMTSPCGAAGIEMQQLAVFCGCVPVEPKFSTTALPEGSLLPLLFGEVTTDLPEWLSGMQILSFTMDKSPIPIPLSVALLLHPDVGFVCIKDPSQEPYAPPGLGAPLRACLAHEAVVRMDRLREIYGPREGNCDTVDAFGLISEPADEDSLLSVPMEVFMLSFEEVPHVSLLLRYQVCDAQPQVSIASLDVLDPRLPTRIARPAPPKPLNPLLAAVNSMVPNPGATTMGKKKPRLVHEEWGGMKFYCPLTKICTVTADRMRLHMEGDLFKRLAASTPSWEDSPEKKALIEQLEEAEAIEEQQKRARRAVTVTNSASS